MYKAQGKPAPKEMDFDRLLQPRRLHGGAPRRGGAQRDQGQGRRVPTSEEVKNGMEQIKDFTLGGLVPPMALTPADHEGGGWVQVWTVKGGKLVEDQGLVPGLSRR